MIKWTQNWTFSTTAFVVAKSIATPAEKATPLAKATPDYEATLGEIQELKVEEGNVSPSRSKSQALKSLEPQKKSTDLSQKSTSLRFYTDSPTMRMRSFRSTADHVDLVFRYLGPTAVTVPLGSGETRNQFGVFLMALNQCNMLYVMLRMERNEVPQVAVQRKFNPGQTTHTECENRGYSIVEPTRNSEPAPRVRVQEDHNLKASVDANFNLTVTLDDHTVWRGVVPREGLSRANALVGVRSDNAKLAFDIDAPPPFVEQNLERKGLLFQKPPSHNWDLKYLPRKAP